MAILRGIWGILVGAIAAALLGTAFDLYRYVWKFPTESYWFIYTWVAGISALAAGWIAVSITGGWGLKLKSPSATSPAGKVGGAQPTKAPAGFADVPGMPTFDYTKPSDPAPAGAAKPAGTQEPKS